MKLFHGSNLKIQEIDLDCCKDYKDFGRGFYLTDDYARAILMARRRTRITNEGEPQISSFLFYPSTSNELLNIKIFTDYNSEWAEFVVNNRDRNSIPPYQHPYDVVIGPVADSRVDPVIESHKRRFGTKWKDKDSLQVLAEQLKFKSKYIQYCFCTGKAIKQLIKDYR